MNHDYLHHHGIDHEHVPDTGRQRSHDHGALESGTVTTALAVVITIAVLLVIGLIFLYVRRQKLKVPVI